MNKEFRQKVYDKYGGHCAYCGSEIVYADMQVDHIVPKCRGGKDDLSDCNPSCRRCNHYKRSSSIATFRRMLVTLQDRIDKIYICQVAKDYKIIEFKKFDGKFYFEKVGEPDEKT